MDRYLCADHVGATLSFDATFPVGFLVRVVISTAGATDQELVLPYEPFDPARAWPLNGKLYLGAYDAPDAGFGDCLRRVEGAQALTPYTITASVIDLAGNASAPSASVSFEFHPARASTEKMGACGCATVSGPASLPLLLLLLGWIAGRRLRRRARHPKANPD
jgi:MYXO-CTERM domain-containing protein